jgi:hypothetical protein
MAENESVLASTGDEWTLAKIDERVRVIEAKVAQAENAYNEFIRSSQDNPIMRMALGKFGLVPNDGIDG